MTLVKKCVKLSILLGISLVVQPTQAQVKIDAYLASHHYTFSLDSGFDAQTQDSLMLKLKPYRLVLQAEGGSHYLKFYTQLPLVWLRFLQQNFHTRRFFMESGYSMQVCTQAFLQTGDTAYLTTRNKRFWKDWRSYNLALPDSDRVLSWGIDFERNPLYIRALQLLFTQTTVPSPAIAEMVTLVRSEPDTLKDCKIVKALTKSLSSSLKQHESDWKQYLGSDRFNDFQAMVTNPGSCDDGLKNRNEHMAERFLAQTEREPEDMYYGELGEAHTVLNHTGVFGNLVNKSPGFEGKVCTVNLYCYQCSTPVEAVNNWPIRDLEPDILKYFIPYCTPGFTLFDLTGLTKYREYGPFLIVAWGQQ
jgi:hypothetical protein